MIEYIPKSEFPDTLIAFLRYHIAVKSVKAVWEAHTFFHDPV